MKFPRRRQFNLVAIILSAVLSTVVAITGYRAWSQTTRTIKIVVATTPGGLIDLLARMLGEQISREQGLTMVVENRPGASEAIGTEAVARAAPDGNTLLIAAIFGFGTAHVQGQTPGRIINFSVRTFSGSGSDVPNNTPFTGCARGSVLVSANLKWQPPTTRCASTRKPSLSIPPRSTSTCGALNRT